MPSDACVHYGRKKIKRARAMLRLLREAIGEDTYRHENAALRDVARPLSRVRDAHIAVETLAGLLKGANEALASRVAPLRRQLRDVRIAARRQTLQGSERAKLGRKLRGVKERVEEWELTAHASSLKVGIRRVYRKGRKALAVARSSPTEEALHEARKQAKYLELAVEPFGERSKPIMADVVERAQSMEDKLGVDRDLALLKGSAIPLVSEINGARDLVGRIERRRRTLRAKALKTGRRLYEKKAAKFIRRFEKDLAESS